MDTKISNQTRREILEALRERYKNASKVETTKILDEFVDISGCHRLAIVRVTLHPEVSHLHRRENAHL